MATSTASTHCSAVVAGEHRFKVDGHSLCGAKISSKPFRVGGHDWAITYYPKGDKIGNGEYSSVFLALQDASEQVVTLKAFSFCLEVPATSSPETSAGEKNKCRYGRREFSKNNCIRGNNKFASIAYLVSSGCLRDDSLVIKCTVEVLTTDLVGEDDADVPPSDLCRQLGSLLESGIAADVTIKIGWFRRFRAHRCVLAARSPVFRALLCGSMRESRRRSFAIKDMDARVFKLLLYFIYNDSLPEYMNGGDTAEEAPNMTQHLLVAADRFAMERLKLLCESMLSRALNTDTVGFTLDFAEKYQCKYLKASCLKYILRNY